jgi:hypothetical protein
MTQTTEQLEIEDQRLQWATFSLSSGLHKKKTSGDN